MDWVGQPTTGPFATLGPFRIRTEHAILTSLFFARCCLQSELAASYAALILADEGIEITADKLVALTTAAKVELEPIWATLLAKALEGKNVKDLLTNVGSGGAGAFALSLPALPPQASY